MTLRGFDEVRTKLAVLPESIFKAFVLEIHRRLVQRTPVGINPGGRTRANWMLTEGEPSTELREEEDPSGEKALAEAVGLVAKLSGDQIAYLINNVPWMAKLEFGGYPGGKLDTTPVKLGTRVPGVTGFTKYELRSIGGFSYQAPEGIVRVTVEEGRLILDELVRELGL